MKLSVGIPTFARPIELVQAIKVLLETENVDFEIIICDNGGSWSQELDDIISSTNSIRYIKNDDNIGVINNTLKCLELATGDYFAWLSDDDWRSNRYFTECLKIIQNYDDENIFGLNKRWIELFKAMVASRCNIIVSGGTGVGKTTFINLLLKEMSPAERVIIIEDTKELSLSSPNVVRLEVFAASKDHSGLSARDLVKNTLRMRPDRIIVGEVRGGELFDLLQAMNTGHDGSMSSIHSNSPGECISRMENLFLMSGFDVPFQVVRKQITQGVDFIIQLGRNREGQRVVNQIMEITGMEGANILSQQLALRDDDGLIGTGISPKNMNKLHRDGALPQDFFNQ